MEHEDEAEGAAGPAPGAPALPAEPAAREVEALADGGDDPEGSAADGPEGSAFDAARRRRPSRRPGRRLKGWLSALFVGLTARLFPPLYYAYCWLVWRTSRRHDGLNATIEAALARHGGVVTLMWHEEVFTVAFSYGPLRGDALASTGNFGRIVTRLLEFCGCNVFRGGSSGSTSRRRQVLPHLIRYMQGAPRCLLGLTVDGSRGPAYRMKTGGLVVARACHAPIYLVRSACAPALRLPTWDRSAIPLPFGRIFQDVVGPYWVAPETTDAELHALRDHLELDLLELADHGARWLGRPHDRRGFPDGWRPRWAPGRLGVPFGPHDLRPDDPPPWARVAGAAPRPGGAPALAG